MLINRSCILLLTYLRYYIGPRKLSEWRKAWHPLDDVIATTSRRFAMPIARCVRPLSDCLRGSLTERRARANQYGGCEAGG
jgi:hypothetical protein